MNTLFRERLLSRDVFTLSQESLLRQLQNGEIFLAASPSLGKLLSQLPESHPIWEQYEILSPILSDSGREPALSNNFEEQYVSTLFVKKQHTKPIPSQTVGSILSAKHGAFSRTGERFGALRA